MKWYILWMLQLNPAEGEMVSKKTSTIYLYIKDDGAASSSGHFGGGAVGLQEDEEEDDE